MRIFGLDYGTKYVRLAYIHGAEPLALRLPGTAQRSTCWRDATALSLPLAPYISHTCAVLHALVHLAAKLVGCSAHRATSADWWRHQET